MALTLILWMILLGMNVVGANSQGCEANINGPLTSDGIALQLSILEINETHPAVVRCHVTCLNQQGIYFPAMGLIITSQERFIEVYHSPYVSSRDGLYEIHYVQFSHCEAKTNYTMEFEYLIYSNLLNINHSIVSCGAAMFTWTLHSIHTCWGQSYGLIRYNSDSAPAGSLTDTYAYTVSLVPVTISHSSIDGSISDSRSDDPGLIHMLISVIVILSIAMIVTVLPLAGGFLYMRSRRRNVIAPQCAQTVEQTLVIKVEHCSEKVVKEKETSFSENSNHSPVQVQLDQKLPDTISSRNIETL